MGRPYAAYLRVYEPLAAFEPGERAHWEDYAAAGSAPRRSAGGELEHALGLSALLTAPPRVPATEREQAFVLREDGVTYVCPWRTRLRSWEALADFREGLPEPLADAFVPRTLADTAAVDLVRWRIDHPERRSHMLTSTWQVPLRWFVLFSGDERRLVLGRRAAPGRAERALFYVTPMTRARRRLARALAVLRRTLEDGAVSEGVADLGRWLEEFHPRSLVELDYGGLVDLLDDDTLRADTSAQDIADALTALADSDEVAAATAYSSVVERMRSLQAREAAN